MKREEIENAVTALAWDEQDKALEETGRKMKKSAEKKQPKNSEGHRSRLRQRFLKSGVDGFAPHELIEMLLFYAIPRRDTKQLAYALLEKFGSVGGVFSADTSELVKVEGITENAAVLFKLIPQLMKIYYSETDKGVSYTNTVMLAELFKPMFIGESSEVFMVACFDNDLKLLGITEISRGTSAYTSIEMRKLMNAAMREGCTMAALAHNHPTSELRPSDEDIAVTRRINELLAAVNVKLMDHIITGGGRTYSMREGGDLGVLD